MRKRGLQDVKRRNRKVIMEAIMESGAMSRVEIARVTELAASTVSTLVSDLLEEGVLSEAGTVTTAGRSRTELTVNPGYGSIAVVEIGRRESTLTCFDMLLKPIRTAVLSRSYISGSELLERIGQCLKPWQDEIPAVVGIGLLFQEDMRESDFRVVYSTGISSESITLREALMTQYRVPIEEEYSVSYTVSDALAKDPALDSKNSAHISLGSRVLARVTLEGREVPLRSGFCEELAASMAPSPDARDWQGAAELLAELIGLLCMLFPLETVFLSGPVPVPEEMAGKLHRLAGKRLPPERIPQLKFLHPEPVPDGNRVMARQVRKRILIS